MLCRDELDHVDAVADRLERRGAQGVGHEVGLPAEQQAVAEKRVRRPRGNLRRELVMAARRDDDRLRLQPDAGRDRVVGRRVAGVQRDQQVDRLVARIGRDGVASNRASS